MKKTAFVVVLLLGMVFAIPAMAEKIEMTDSELALICAQGWGPGEDLTRNLTGEPEKALPEASLFPLDQLSMSKLADSSHGVEINLAPTVITIDSIRSETPMGIFAMGNLTVRVKARIRLTN